MDVKIIEQKQLVERYLFGRLSPPEAKFFERIVRQSPELADKMGLPAALKRVMHLLDETDTEWRGHAPSTWHKPWLLAALAVLVLVAGGVAVSLWASKNDVSNKYSILKGQAALGLLPPPTSSRTIRMHAAHPGERPPVYMLGSRSSPALAELLFDVAYVKGNLFQVVVKRDDGTYWGRLENQLRDSNGDLRLAVNVAAFAAGGYEVEIDAVNLRGEGAPVGRVRLRVDSN
jgi:hypothetical protein